MHTVHISDGQLLTGASISCMICAKMGSYCIRCSLWVGMAKMPAIALEATSSKPQVCTAYDTTAEFHSICKRLCVYSKRMKAQHVTFVLSCRQGVNYLCSETKGMVLSASSNSPAIILRSAQGWESTVQVLQQLGYNSSDFPCNNCQRNEHSTLDNSRAIMLRNYVDHQPLQLLELC